jgi:ParB-like chromosome segregation protein Spo0J
MILQMRSNIKIEWIGINGIKINPNNPRIIKDDKFHKLVNSIKEFPKMLEIRPIVVNDNMIVLGGNMRLKACKKAGLKEVPIIKASDLTEEEQRQFIIKDNVSGGEWDWDMLANEWDIEQLDQWGLDIPNKKEVDEQDLFNIELPFYQPSKIMPTVKELAETFKTKTLNKKIDKLNASEELKEVLKIRASFFTDFDFQKIADYYYNQREEVKEVMEELGMVILAPKEAVRLGFAEMQEEVFDL